MTTKIGGFTYESAGCYIDDSHSQAYSSVLVCDLAATYGCPDKNVLAFAKFSEQDLTKDLAESVSDAALVAEDWLTDNCAPDGYVFTWLDGEFVLIQKYLAH